MSDTHFVVSRLNWRRLGGDRGFMRLPGTTRITAFDAFEDAVAFRLAEEDKARRVVNPFFPGRPATVAEVCALPEPIYRDWLHDRGIDPPAADTAWHAWWTAAEPTWDARQRAAAWEKLTVDFYTAEERPRRPVVYTVVQLGWFYSDEYYTVSSEGGRPLTSYRSGAEAEAECEALNAAAREEQRRRNFGYGWYASHMYSMALRRFPGRTPFDAPPPLPVSESGYTDHFSADDVPFFEVHAIELEGGAAGGLSERVRGRAGQVQSVCIVGRVSTTVFQQYGSSAPYGVSQDYCEGRPAIVPVAAVELYADAEAIRGRLETEARRTAAFGTTVSTRYADSGWGLTVRAAIRALDLDPPELTPPPPSYRYAEFAGDALAAWWQDNAPAISPEQNEFLWNSVHPEPFFYDVHEGMLND